MCKSKILWALAVLNVALAGLLVARNAPANTAQAQPARRPGDYLMIPGRVAGGNSTVVYILDTANGVLAAATYNDTTQTLDKMAPINLSRVFQQGGGPVRPGVKGGAGVR